MFFLMILGIALWIGAHVFKRLAPEIRSGLGEKGKGPVALVLLLSVVLMVIGYRNSAFVPVYDLGAGAKHVAVIVMLPVIAFMGLGSSSSRVFITMRHPMLTGFVLWTGVHLLANGDRDSIVLFGSLGAWAILQMWLINREEGYFTPKRKEGTVAGDVRLLIISVVLYAVIAAVHIWLGKNPFTP